MSRALLLAVWLGAAAAGSAAGLAGAAGPGEPDLKTVLRLAGEYVRDYPARLAELVGEEHYVQRTWVDFRRESKTLPTGVRPAERVMRSDILCIRGFTARDSWIGVREVFEIDGVPVEEERGRLRALLTNRDTPASVSQRALADQQARYNLGELYRTINVPISALQFLRLDQQWRSRFKHDGNAVFHGVSTWKVEFTERERPTLIRTPDWGSVPSKGAFWIDPATGAVLRTELHAGEDRARGFRSLVLVSYRLSDKFGMLLPDDMNEEYLVGRRRIQASATYSNYRRFETDVKIAVPR